MVACWNRIDTKNHYRIQSSYTSLRWRQNERNGVSNHQPHDCLPNRLFRHRWKKTSQFLFKKCLKKSWFLNFSKVDRWLVGEVYNHVGINGSKMAEGFSAFQRRSCFFVVVVFVFFTARSMVSLSFIHHRSFGDINSLWPSDTIWRHSSGSTLAQVMTNYVNQCWLIISEVQWHSY